MRNAVTISAEGRRALLLLLDKGSFTKGRRGYYGGFTTTGGGRPVKLNTLNMLMREGWLERDSFTGIIRITSQGVIMAETLRREGSQAVAHANRPSPSSQPARRAPQNQQPRTVRLPYVD